jgi:hypothetical protein
MAMTKRATVNGVEVDRWLHDHGLSNARKLRYPGSADGGLCEVGNDERAFIAQTWLGHFNR